MKNERLLIILRYISIILLILSIVLFKENNIDWFAVILVLLIIINSQVRIFLVQSSILLTSISILIELALIYFCYKTFNGILFFYYITILLDSAFLLRGKTSYIMSSLIILSLPITGIGLPVSELVTCLCSIILFGVFSYYIKKEYAGKLKAQRLYDKLRISEEKLKKANKDLETYANSIEELTLLRERNRISREIHDSVGHSLSTTIIQLGAIEKIAKQNGDTAASLASNLREFVKASLQEVRTAVRELKPREFEKYEGILALEELIKNFVKLTTIDVKLGFSNNKWVLNSDQSFVIYRVVQEFLSNSLRHGKATKINIFLNFSKESLVITLQDNGVGCDDIKKGIGLSSIWERVTELGGSVEYNSKKQEGFLLKVVLIPIEVIEF